MFKNPPIIAVYLATFFYALHYALTLYIESSFVEGLAGPYGIGIFFTLAAIISIVINFNITPALRRFGNYKILLFAVVLEGIAVGILATGEIKELVLGAFISHLVLLNLMFLSLSVFLESFSKDETTGRTRGIFLTILNTAVLAGPFIASSVIGDDDYKNVFFWSVILLFPILFFAGNSLRSFSDPKYDKISFSHGLGQVLARDNIRNVVLIQFLLEFFFGIMVVYGPIYLHKEIGIGLPEILGIIMPIALLPFVVLPYILGNLADRRFGEKEMLFVGFLMMIFSTIYLSFIDSREIFIWAIALLLTRIGASIVETMAESYFFKQIDATDTHLIAFFRNLRSMSYILAPVVASAFIVFFPFRYIFMGLAIAMLLGLRVSFKLKDTR